MRKLLVFSIVLLSLLICSIIGVGGYIVYSQLNSRIIAASKQADSSRVNTAPTRLAESQPTVLIPTVSVTSTPAASNSTLDTLLNLDIPRDNPLELVPRFKGINNTLATPVSPKVYKVGDKASFWVSRDITGTYELATATLKYVTPHAYVWLEDGLEASDSSLRKAGDTFEQNIYPTDRKYLGSEPTPGIDNDPHIFILNTSFRGGAIGYFLSADTFPPYINRFSNQHEMFYMNAKAIEPGTDYYSTVLAHEFAHMIHWNQNKRESSWITEGLGNLAIDLNGLPLNGGGAFAADTDLQLDSWAPLGNSIPHYDAAYLFLAYVLNRFGDDFIRDIISSGTSGIATVQKALDDKAPGLRFDDVFADWVVANYVSLPNDGVRYSYPAGELDIRPTVGYSRYPVSDTGTVHQYGTDYIQLLPSKGDVTFTFDGAKTVPVIPTTPHSGKMFWWGSRTDQSDARLTREFDLTNVHEAALNFWTWYDLERDFDYAYVSVSSDDGTTWHPLTGNSTTDSDPNGQNYGNGITCKSGVGCAGEDASARWIQEQMDLTPYAGKKILLRFEAVTDAIYTGPGFAVDDISIPAINFSDDVESGDNGWLAEGFAMIDNVLPQRFIVQAIEFGSNPKVVPIALDANNHGTYSTHGLGKDLSRVVIAVSGSTPITWEEADYSYRIE